MAGLSKIPDRIEHTFPFQISELNLMQLKECNKELYLIGI